MVSVIVQHAGTALVVVVLETDGTGELCEIARAGEAEVEFAEADARSVTIDGAPDEDLLAEALAKEGVAHRVFADDAEASESLDEVEFSGGRGGPEGALGWMPPMPKGRDERRRP